MSSSPPAPDPIGDPDPQSHTSSTPGAHSAAAAHVTPAAGRVWCLALCAGVLGGALGWLGGEAVHKEYPLVPFALGQEAEFNAQFSAMRGKVAADTTLAFALQGGALGLALGLAGGLARGSIARGLGAGLVGALLAAAACASAVRVLMPLYERYAGTTDDEMVVPLLVHGGIWVAAGALGGLAFGLGLGGLRAVLRSLAGGLVGAALGTVAYELLGAIAFPMAHTGELLSTTWSSRLFARMIVAVLCGVGIALALADPRGHARKGLS